MNPAAQEFVPRKQRIDAPAPLHPLLPTTPSQQQQTKLRASAPAFVPKASALSAAPRPFQPLPNPPTQPSPLESAVSTGEPQPSPSAKTLSLNATPYTPTNPKVAAKFPVSPQPQSKSNESKTPAQQTTPPQITKVTAVGGFSNRVESSAPRDSSVASTSVTDEASGSLAPMGGGVLAETVENDFSGSALPMVFDVKRLNTPAPEEPIRFNTMWALYADDHPTPFGVPLAYDPVLVHHVGNVESFWRLWRYLPPPSMLMPAFTYHWFRRDIKPNWEHARNKNGGTVTIVIFDRDKPGQNSKQTMDDAFMAMLIACCGETLAESSTMNGMMLKVRQNKPTTLQLWTASSDQRKLKALAQSLRNLLEKIIGQKPLQKLEYFSHQQTQMGGPGSLAGRMKGKPSRMTPDFTL